VQLIAQGAKNVQFHFYSTRVEISNVKSAYFTFNRCAAHGGAFMHKIAQNTYFAQYEQLAQIAQSAYFASLLALCKDFSGVSTMRKQIFLRFFRNCPPNKDK